MNYLVQQVSSAEVDKPKSKIKKKLLMVLKAHIGWNNRVMGFFKMLFFFMFIWILLKRGNTDFVIRNKKELLKCGAKFWTHYLSLDMFFSLQKS